MSKRPNTFRKFNPPKKAGSHGDDKKNGHQHPVPIAIQASSDSEPESAETTNIKTLAVPKTGNLVIKNDNFTLISSYLNRIFPVVRRRVQTIRNHDSIAGDLNSGKTPSICRVSESLPTPPQGVSFSAEFTASHRAKAQSFARRLAKNIAEEYQRVAELQQKEIDTIVEEAETAIYLIIDEEEQHRSLQLFRVKLSALYRRAANNHTQRRNIKAYRRAQPSTSK